MASGALSLGSLDDDIFLGFWVNRSFGNIRGATLTLDRGRGGLLIAFLALFVGASGRGLWKITRCVLHFALSSDASSDGLYLQRQAILRNSRLALDAAMDLIQACLVWRRRAKGSNQRVLPVASSAVLIAFAIVVAGTEFPFQMYSLCLLMRSLGIFSSRVVSTNANEALIAGKGCNANLSISGLDTEYYTVFNMKSAEHLDYAMKCYQRRNSAQSDTCNLLTRATLPYHMEANATCPFSKEICSKSTENFLLETDFLDSYEDLGMNKGPRFTVKLKHHCAPLVTKGFTTPHVDTRHSNVTMTSYNYMIEGADTGVQVPLNRAVFGEELFDADYRV
jgi:hypothetical protein